MKVECPKCRKAIAADDVNVAKDVGFCRGCNEAFALSDVVEEEDYADIDLNAPPEGVTVTPLENGLAVDSSMRSSGGWFFVPFALFWNGMVSIFLIVGVWDLWKWAVTGQGVEGNMPFPGFILVFMIPFVIAGLVVSAVAATCVFGHLAVRIEGDDGLVLIGVGRHGWRRRFKWSEVDSVREGRSDASVNDQPLTEIVLGGPKPLEFGTLLRKDRRRYLAALLRRFLRERRSTG